MIRRFALVFACCAALVACKPGESSLSIAESDAEALIGKEFLLSASQGRFVESSPCEFVSSGAIWENGKEQIGWFDGVTLCRGIPVLFLAKTRESPLLQDGDRPILSAPHRQVVAVKALPQVANYSEKDMGPDPLVLIDPVAGQCATDLPGDPFFYVLARWGGRDSVRGSPGIAAVWGIDVQNRRFVSLDPERFTCEKLSMD
jgi:hypothetical protein